MSQQMLPSKLQTVREAIFNHKIDILESKIFELEKLSDKQFEINETLKKELQDLKSEVKTRISSLQTKLGQALQKRKHL